jgi:hypothetical protein
MQKPLRQAGGPRCGSRHAGLPAAENRTATHVVRSGMNECFVTSASGARTHLVSDHFRLSRVVDTYRLAV